MEIKAKLNYLRISPRKVRLVADLIRGLEVSGAESQLKFLSQRAALPILKLLNSAVANAYHNFGIEKDGLYVSKITVNTGPMLKRWRPRSRGMAVPIKKRTSHVELILEAKKAIKAKKVKKAKVVEAKEPIREEAEKATRTERRPIFKPEKKIKKPQGRGIVQKIFRRKVI